MKQLGDTKCKGKLLFIIKMWKNDEWLDLPHLPFYESMTLKCLNCLFDIFQHLCVNILVKLFLRYICPVTNISLIFNIIWPTSPNWHSWPIFDYNHSFTFLTKIDFIILFVFSFIFSCLVFFINVLFYSF